MGMAQTGWKTISVLATANIQNAEDVKNWIIASIPGNFDCAFVINNADFVDNAPSVDYQFLYAVVPYNWTSASVWYRYHNGNYEQSRNTWNAGYTLKINIGDSFTIAYKPKN